MAKAAKVCFSDVLLALDTVVLKQEAWEDNEDIMTVNGEPVGGTISRAGRGDVDRWWPSLRRKLAAVVTAELNKEA